MKLQIEQWISNNDFSENINVLFEDSVICYKSGANRASLLFSYLAFMTILKERIIGGVKPNLFPQGEWDVLIKKLQNEDKWEAGVFDATQQQEKVDPTSKSRTKDPIFNLNDNLRNQIKYWKDRRNDCAHYKDNIIENYHVESFWAFIKSNLSKITIEGGMQTLLNKISKHFDPTFTPPNKDITPLVQEIESSVEVSKLAEFWDSLMNDSQYNYDLSKSKQILAKKSLEVHSDKINEPLIDILKSNDSYLNDFLSSYPEKIIRFNYSEAEIRNFWKTKLIRFDNIIGVYATLLRNCLIPKSEIDESNTQIISKLRVYVAEAHDHQVLVANGFFDSFKTTIINNEKFEEFLWVNEKADIISSMILAFPADLDVAKRLCLVYGQSTNSNWLLERFDRELLPNQQLRDDYKQMILSNNISIPSKLQKYFA